MNVRPEIREQVIEAIIEAMLSGEANGSIDPVDHARRLFPGTPSSVLYEAKAELDIRREQEWWTQVERTIDLTVVRDAITTAGAPEVASAANDDSPRLLDEVDPRDPFGFGDALADATSAGDGRGDDVIPF